MNITDFIWMDGNFVSWNDAKVHPIIHTFHYGSGVFEGIRVYKTEKGPAIFRLQEHVDRLFFSAEVLSMKIPFTKEEIFSAIIDTVAKNKLEEGYIRPLIYYGYGKMGLGVSGAPVNVLIAVWPWGKYLSENPIKIGISSYIRTHPKTTNPAAKITGNYQNSILSHEEAIKKGYDEALLLDYKGHISEGPGENFFLVKDGTLHTPPLGTILPGITRATIIELAKEIGIETIEKNLTFEDVQNADEAFFTGTAAEVTIIGSIDSKKFGENYLISTKLKNIYESVVKGKTNHASWLTFIPE